VASGVSRLLGVAFLFASFSITYTSSVQAMNITFTNGHSASSLGPSPYTTVPALSSSWQSWCDSYNHRDPNQAGR